MKLEDICIGNDWDAIFDIERQKPYFQRLWQYLEREYHEFTIFPSVDKIFSAFKLTPLNEVKVVIIGQDPYHNCNQAEGLAFSVPDDCIIPPSLRNILLELHNDLNIDIPEKGSLEKWAREGVLLINSVLTVRASQPNSHKGQGWELFTDNIIKTISLQLQGAIFVLWGNNARAKTRFIDLSKHHIIESPHPSPLSAYKGFFDSKPFSRINEILGHKAIDWKLY